MKTADEIFKLGTPDEVVKELTSSSAKTNWNELKKQFDQKLHEVFDLAKRPDKVVAGKSVEVARIGFNYQKKIVETAVAFLFANPVKIQSGNLDSDGIKVKKMVEHILDKNKVYSFNRKLARILFRETEVAEYWYPVEDAAFWSNTEIKSKIRLRCQLFAQSKGDQLFPYFNEFGDMIAFSRLYKLKINNKDVEHLDVFTSSTIATYIKEQANWQVLKSTPNPIKKIPIVYYAQEEAEWEEVQSTIDRIEKLISNFADTNDYFGSPMIKLKGTIKSMPEKGSSGKVIQLSEGADAEYLTWSQAPEAIKTEYEILRSHIFNGTNTPNLSFDDVKSLGNVSGVSLKLMFLDAHLKSLNKLEFFDEGFARRLSILKAYCASIQTTLANAVENANFWFTVTPFLPENTKELFENLSMLTGGKQLVSQKTAIGMTGIVEDVENEISEIKKDSVSDIGEAFA